MSIHRRYKDGRPVAKDGAFWVRWKTQGMSLPDYLEGIARGYFRDAGPGVIERKVKLDTSDGRITWRLDD